jgi:Ni,Fe-hydrogenase III component G
MTPSEVADFLDNPSQEDIDEINDYLKEFRSLSVAEQSKHYDVVQVDIESLKNYIKKLAKDAGLDDLGLLEMIHRELNDDSAVLELLKSHEASKIIERLK